MKKIEIFESVVIPCPHCGMDFDTFWCIPDGMPMQIFCGDICELEYYSKKESRNRNINYLLNENRG